MGDGSTCVDSDVETESFAASLEDSSTSFIDKGNRNCVTYAISDASTFVDQCFEIYDMYETTWDIAHSSRQRNLRFYAYAVVFGIIAFLLANADLDIRCTDVVWI